MAIYNEAWTDDGVPPDGSAPGDEPHAEGPGRLDDRRAARQARCEDRFARAILGRLGLDPEDYRQQQWSLTGSGRISMALLDRALRLPVRLGAREVPYLHQLSRADLHRRLTRLPLF